MFFEVEMLRDVAVPSKLMDRNGLFLQRYIVTRLLENLLSEKASRDLGYFLAVSTLKSIRRGESVNESGDVSFRILFECRTFLPIRGEILQGVVYATFSFGVILRCGPVKYALISPRLMPNYHYVSGEKPFFSNEELGKIENGVVVRFLVIGVGWIEKGRNLEKEFLIFGRVGGESLGPISLPGTDEIDL
ncbi:DNA-directed RNA polymerase II subunit [Melia azedarach]|uniref:DNA-directed RNA polymerase II subunit n=1 Tax=Melia azedarach TaxID=155640 RepID=A0ACC1YIX0_MELAZ|nr:DNA-directed RNA polymerase II subunit [Melia azedarach]